MFEAFEYKGFWWLPGNIEDKFPGTLKFNVTDGARLEINGSSENIRRILKEDLFHIILGAIYKGEVTLCECQISNSTIVRQGMSLVIFRIDTVLIGKHYHNKTGIVFDNCQVSFSNLESWFNLECIEAHRDKDTRIETIKYVPHDSIEFNIDDQIKIEIDFLESVSESPHSYSIEQNVAIQFIFARPVGLDALMRDIYKLNNFFSLAIWEPVDILFIRSYADAPFQEVSIYYQPVYDKKTVSVAPFQMLFRYDDVKDEIGTYFSNWHSKWDLLEPVMELYFSQLYKTPFYLQTHFIMIMTAIEVFHRLTQRNKLISKEQHESFTKLFKESARNKAPREWLDAMSAKLPYLNEPSLRQRLTEMLRKNNKLADATISDKHRFIDLVCNTRNYLTHYNADLKNRTAQGMELAYIVRILKLLLESMFLAEIGFAQAKIEALIINSQKVKWMLRAFRKINIETVKKE